MKLLFGKNMCSTLFYANIYTFALEPIYNIQHHCANSGYRLQDHPEAMDDREAWRERVREICAGSAAGRWWYIKLNVHCQRWSKVSLSNSYYIKVWRRALLLSLDCFTYPWSYLIMPSVKQRGIKYHFWVFVMTRPENEPLSLGLLANTLPKRTIT